MPLHAEQERAFALVKEGKHVFLTGPAGAGKSYLLRTITEWAVATGKVLALTALTGCAAILLGSSAKTLHSWAGVGLGKESAVVLAANIGRNFFTKRRWLKTHILVIDEISMMTPEFFEKLDQVARLVRRRTRPFGGLQLVLCGDFYQLPPVSRGISGEMPGRFAFESPLWASCGLTTVVLQQIERQKDPAFQKLLNECRVGVISAESTAALHARMGLNWKKQVIKPTLLFSKNADVDSINEKNLQALKKPLRTFTATTTVGPKTEEGADLDLPSKEQVELLTNRLDLDSSYSPVLELCEGCQVMLLTNLSVEEGLVNGSRGVIVEFTAEGLPVVQFLRGLPRAIDHHSWVSPEHSGIARRQLPLRVAYAITIHKSQGATLDCALVDIGDSTFEYGQAYVALSRVRDLDSLFVFALDPTKIMAHPAVKTFYDSLLPGPTVTRAPVSALPVDIEVISLV